MSDLQIEINKINEIRSYLNNSIYLNIEFKTLLAAGLTFGLFPFICLLFFLLHQNLDLYLFLNSSNKTIFEFWSFIKLNSSEIIFNSQLYFASTALCLLLFLVLTKFMGAKKIISNNLNPIAKKFNSFWQISILTIVLFGITLMFSDVNFSIVSLILLVSGLYFSITGFFNQQFAQYMGYLFLFSGIIVNLFFVQISNLSYFLIFYIPCAIYLSFGILVMLNQQKRLKNV
jgi:hypothetical protein